jgi:uncharacterized membrane protein YgcG
VLSCHPDNPADVLDQTLAVAHSLAVVGGAPGAADTVKLVVDLVSDNDEDVKPAVRKEGDGGNNSSGGGRHSGGRRGGGSYGGRGDIGY